MTNPPETRSVLFTDVERSTTLRVERGDDEANKILRAVDDAVESEVARHGGALVKRLGDGCLASFASARAAVSCAMDIQRTVAAGNAAGLDRGLRVRVGVNAGEVSEDGGDIAGQAVNGAARIAGEAAGGEILVSRVVKDLVGSQPGLVFLDRGPVVLRGFPEPWDLFEVRGPSEPEPAALPEIRVLGPIEVTTPKGRVEFGGRHERALLSALAAYGGQPVDTDRLADALWADQPPRSAAKVVQNVVLRVRKALEPGVIETHPPGYVLNTAAVVIDLQRFDELIATARTASENSDHQRASTLLSEALSLWRGPPLPDLADWGPARTETARLEELRDLAREERAAAELAAGRHAAVLADLQAMVREAPLRERGWALLMTALYRDGRQADALRVYQEARTVLVDALGVEPGPELRRIEAAILAQDDELLGLRSTPTTASSAWPPALPAALASHTGAFVGRVDEMERLWRAWELVRTGERQLALVSGEPGVGKTRLVAELARRVHDEGGAVLFGRCDEDTAPPYQPFVEALRTYVAACPSQELTEHVGSYGGDAARLFPELQERLPSVPAPLQADAETERYRLFEAVVGLVRGATANPPALLVLDDLHWGAKPTLLMLRHLARSDNRAALLVVGTYRDTELGRRHPLREVLADLWREPAVERIPLRGLNEEEVTDFVLATAGQPLDADLAELAHDVYATTEGNPFFVGQVLRHLAESGAVTGDGGLWLRAASGSSAGIPEGVREVVSRRLDQLDDETRAALTVAAVIGLDFDVGLLTAACDLDPEQMLDALETAEQARLVEPAETPSRFEFVHALVRSTLYEEIPSTRRMRHHRGVARALEPLAAKGNGDHLAALARHYCEAAPLGEAPRAVTYATAAAVRAFDGLAYEEAADLYARALSVLEPDTEDDREHRGELLIGLARARWATGDRDGARQAAYEAAQDGRDTDQPELLADAAFVLGGGYQAWSEAGVIDQALLSLCEEALENLPARDSTRRATVTARLARELYLESGTSERRQELADDALAMARRLGDPATLAYALGSAHYVLWVPGTAPQRLAIAEEILRLGRGSGNREVEYGGASWAFMDLMELGETSRADEMLAEVRRLVEELHQPQYLWMAREYDTARALMDGRLDDAARLAEEALALGQAAQAETALQFYGAAQIELARSRGGLEDLTAVASTMVEQYPLVPAWRCALVYLNALLERPEAIRPHLDLLAADDFSAIRRDANWMIAIAMLITGSAAVSDRDRSARLYELLLPYREYCVTAMPAVTVGSTETFLCIAAASAGQWDAADQHLALGTARNTEIGCRTWVVNGTYEYAKSLARSPEGHDPDRLRDLLHECVSLGSDIGMTRVVGQATSLAGEAGISLD